MDILDNYYIFLNLVDAVVCDVDIIPHYGEEKSGLRVWNILPKLTFFVNWIIFQTCI